MGVATGAVMAVFLPEADLWLPLCVTLGYAVHLAGDLLTEQGVPLLWPLPIKSPTALHHIPVVNRIWMPNGHFALPVLGTPGSMRETVLLFLLTLYCMAAVAFPAAVAAGVVWAHGTPPPGPCEVDGRRPVMVSMSQMMAPRKFGSTGTNLGYSLCENAASKDASGRSQI